MDFLRESDVKYVFQIKRDNTSLETKSSISKIIFMSLLQSGPFKLPCRKHSNPKFVPSFFMLVYLK